MAQVPLTDVIIRRHGQGTAAPTAGEFHKSDIVWNLEPAVGQPVGWVCIVSGTPGTWRPFGQIYDANTI